MRKLTLATTTAMTLVCGSAFAADLRVAPMAPAPAAVVAYNWSGFYIGAHVGGGWGRKHWSFLDAFGDTFSRTRHKVDGIFAGGQLGFNWQVGNIVFGIEGEGSWSDIDGRSTCPNPAAICRSNIDWLASVTGRLGFAWDAALLYVKGGWAWAGEEYFVRFPATPIFDESTGELTRNGPTIGGGIEWGFTPNWSAKIEYMYTHFGREAHDFHRIETGVFVEDARIRQHLHTVKFGINYRFGGFGGGPVVASY